MNEQGCEDDDGEEEEEEEEDAAREKQRTVSLVAALTMAPLTSCVRVCEREEEVG